MSRPLSVATKADRKAFDDLGLMQHYEDVYASRFRWSGGPDTMPEDWPERAVFRSGLLGCAEAYGSVQLCAGNQGLLDIYGQPLNFFPTTENSVIPDGWNGPHDGPTVYYEIPPSREIFHFIDLMKRSYRCMRSNVRVMSQPIVIQGTIGSELNAKECNDAIDGENVTIYSWDRTGADAKVIDLGGRDHTESIIKIINDMDCEILARFGIKSPGTEKASGVTAEETLSIGQELRLILERDLRKRRRFCERVQDVLPGLKVEPAPGLLDTYFNDNSDGAEHDIGEADTFRGHPVTET